MGAELGWVCHRVVLHGPSESNILGTLKMHFFVIRELESQRSAA